MTYTEKGMPVFRKLGPRATFTNVCETTGCMGYDISFDKRRPDWVILNWFDEKEMYRSRPIRINELVDFLNAQMIERGYIKKEIEP